MLDRLRRKRRSVPLSIITGFLGSGKTTVLNHVLRQPQLADTAVIINEFGEIGIDNLVVEQVDEKMMVLSSGCICCTVRGDILTALRDLFARRAKKEIPWFRQVMVETTGLANPAPVVHALVASPAARARVHLDTIATVVDASMGLSTLEAHPEAVQQVALADTLLLSKSDLADASTMARLREQLQTLNPGATHVLSKFGRVDPTRLYGRDAFDPGRKSPDVSAWLDTGGTTHSHTHGIKTWTLSRDEPFTDAAFHRLVKTLSSVGEKNLLRVKGIVDVAGRPALIHGVQHAFYPPRWLSRWPSKDRKSRLVFITRNLDETDLGFLARGFERAEA